MTLIPEGRKMLRNGGEAALEVDRQLRAQG
jgi:hypothetical protein